MIKKKNVFFLKLYNLNLQHKIPFGEKERVIGAITILFFRLRDFNLNGRKRVSSPAIFSVVFIVVFCNSQMYQRQSKCVKVKELVTGV